MKKHFHRVYGYLHKHRKQIVVALGVGATTGIFAITLNYMLIGRYEQYVFRDTARLAEKFGTDKPVGIVLGGGVTDDGKPMPLLQDRLDATAKLLDEGHIRKVIVSGDNRFKSYDEPTVMRDYLIREKSIDPSLIQPDFAGRSTYETCERARKIFELHKTVLISESTHLPRAVYLCRSFGVEAYGFKSDGQSSSGLKIGQRWREVLARTKATLNVYILGERTVLGEKIWQSEADINPFTPPETPQPYVQELMRTMALRDKVASLFIVHTPGTDPSGLAVYAASHKPSGLIFMGDNISPSQDQLKAATTGLTTDKQLRALTAIDQEGDPVKRLAEDEFPGAEQLRTQSPEATRSAFDGRSTLLKDAGMNLNFGIVADITADTNSFIYDRVLGTTPEAASARVAQAVIGSRSKTLSTLKHFPGHGEAAGDSHGSIPSTTTSYDDWQKRVAPPFKAGIAAQADMVMFGHLRYSAIDAAPATLSKKWHDVLRSDLGFKGIAITDDMVMLQNSGEPAYTDPVKNAVDALAAGNDVLLYVLDHYTAASKVDVEVLINGVMAATADGRLDSSIIDQRAQRVLTLRHHLTTTQ